MLISQIVFWEPSVSPHKLALAAALARQPEICRVRYIAHRGLSVDRVRQGWEVDVPSTLEVCEAPKRDEVAALFAGGDERTVHLVSGLRRVPTIVGALAEARGQSARYAILSEPRASEGLRGFLRRAESWATEGPIRRSAGVVLAIGRHGPPWFRSTGYPSALIHPFAYFLPEIVPATLERREGKVRVGYLGRLVAAKGIDLFLDAVAHLPDHYCAEIAGHGALADMVERAAAVSGGRLQYRGTLPMAEVPAFLSGLDVLVVPSRTTDDGWGAVVSEALMAGVVVVASKQVGASICLEAPWRGAVVSSLSSTAFVEAVQRVTEPSMLTSTARAQRSRWARERLSAEAGARYLLAILAHRYNGAPRPTPFFVDTE